MVTDRTVWIWRFVAILIIVVFALLMWSLHARLSHLERQRPAAESSTHAPERLE